MAGKKRYALWHSWKAKNAFIRVVRGVHTTALVNAVSIGVLWPEDDGITFLGDLQIRKSHQVFRLDCRFDYQALLDRIDGVLGRNVQNTISSNEYVGKAKQVRRRSEATSIGND
jgi:hypothetical protein